MMVQTWQRCGIFDPTLLPGGHTKSSKRMACGCCYPAIWVLDELFPLFSIQLPIIAWQKCPFVLVPPVPWVQFSSRTNFGYSGIPSVSSAPSLRSLLLFKTCARKSEQFFGNRDFICITGSEGGGRKERGDEVFFSQTFMI